MDKAIASVNGQFTAPH